MILTGEHVVVRDFLRQDLDSQVRWKPYEHPFLEKLNLVLGLPKHRDNFFEERMNRKDLLWFAVDDKHGKLVGELTLRNISWVAKSAVLGIKIGAEYMHHGYGSESIQLLLEYCFSVLGFERIALEVAAYNKNAIRCYEKCGFSSCGTHWGSPNPRFDTDVLDQDEYHPYREYFRRNRMDVYEALFYDMERTREAYQNAKG